MSDVVALRVGYLEPGLSAGDAFIPLTRITKKNKITAHTFLGPESLDAIRDYLEYRRKGTRRIAPEHITTDSPLFRARVSDDV